MLCPCCAMDVETIRHMYESCNHPEIEKVRLGAEKMCCDMVQDIMDDWRVNTELVKINGVGSSSVPWGVWGIISGSEQGVVTCPWGEKVWKKIQELRGYPRWLWALGLVPKCFQECLRDILIEHAGLEGEVCTWKHGAKMGVGRNRNCAGGVLPGHGGRMDC